MQLKISQLHEIVLEFNQLKYMVIPFLVTASEIYLVWEQLKITTGALMQTSYSLYQAKLHHLWIISET